MTPGFVAARSRSAAIALAGFLAAACFAQAARALPAAPEPVETTLSAGDAAEVVGSVLGAVIVDVDASQPDRFTFDVRGLAKGRACPLDGVRDVRCGAFAFAPSRIVVMRRSPVAALSGHLARNRLVVVDMESYEAAIASGTLHGVLVFPTERVTVRDRPAFAWYVSREGASLDLELRDLDRDGVLDLFYTYSQWMPGGIRVVSRDVWTFVAMQASKMLSSGEKLSGVAASMFDGVPLLRDDDQEMLRSAWHVVPLGDGLPSAVVVEQARLGRDPGWELHVIADLGGGWREYLVGTSRASAEGFDDSLGDDPNCRPADTTFDLGLEARRRLLDLESACRVAAAAPAGRGVAALARLWAAWRAESAGLPLVAVGLAESASRDLSPGWPATWPLSALISLDVARTAGRVVARVFASGWQGDPGSWLAAARELPALAPVLVPIDLLRRRLVEGGSFRVGPNDESSVPLDSTGSRAPAGV